MKKHRKHGTVIIVLLVTKKKYLIVSAVFIINYYYNIFVLIILSDVPAATKDSTGTRTWELPIVVLIALFSR